MYSIYKLILITSSTIFSLGILSSRILAQSNIPPGVNIPPDPPDPIERTSPPEDEPSKIPPRTPEPQNPILTPPENQKIPKREDDGFFKENFFVKQVEILGSTVLQEEINELKSKFEKRQVSFEELLQLRSEITKLYIDNGYINSGAFLLSQIIDTDGVVKIQVVEGELEDIQLTGLNRLRANYVRSRIKRATTAPLNKNRLERALQLLQIDPLISQVNAELTAGSTPGKNILKLIVKEAPAFHAGVFTRNSQSPSIGSLQAGIFAVHDNVLGFGDSLRGEYGITEGLNLYDINYTFPVNSKNGKIGFRFTNTDSRIIEDDFEDIDIRSEAQTYSLNFRQPLILTPNSEFALGLALDLRRSQTFILDDIPFSFSQGAEDGESNVTVIRFSQDWVQRNTTTVLAARSQFSFGIGAFDATTNNSGTDGRFFSWLGQFQWVQQVTPRSILVSRLNAQLTPDSLLSLEKFSAGGVNTVRGYRQNELVTDNAVTGSVELFIPLTSNSNELRIAPFFDIAAVWNNRGSNPNPNIIAGTGVGLLWQPRPDLNLRLDYGLPLVSVEDRGNTLQDNGLYFSVQYQPF
ncbi:MAG: ShlB/FhaC/HecB family hemolysin secretion/activation protein [Mastigocoleus sp. MO_167.B18]|uniref:ShlB/FhaC/HecB family hemolysin secretion/activation protein n=1 Tax=Mastigocoleus sp. MO_188.B34 TaxID=3036635 RepID=UPI0026032AA4|nr:ShlB/FhaC/HecB family hemolysin secretion/activation protein [Mastigocoleus sp. MO_188.B34]MDJ0696016.1 ShlB/FhaC/HecB family hemolysin secretion/activation protein [Mastigocoleus sp. MO_188.B34]MDJ0772078.1 ShlB/FhaC/HecB family hemolysin secretion/activation protein [Mastigocoleus sp. MO_167.B18]